MSRGYPAAGPRDCVNTPTRSRTRNVSFEARYDVRFTTGVFKRKARDLNPHPLAGNRLSSAARPTVSGYLPSMDSPGIEPEFPARQAGVFPLDHEPVTVDRRGLEPRFPT